MCLCVRILNVWLLVPPLQAPGVSLLPLYQKLLLRNVSSLALSLQLTLAEPFGLSDHDGDHTCVTSKVHPSAGNTCTIHHRDYSLGSYLTIWHGWLFKHFRWVSVPSIEGQVPYYVHVSVLVDFGTGCRSADGAVGALRPLIPPGQYDAGGWGGAGGALLRPSSAGHGGPEGRGPLPQPALLKRDPGLWLCTEPHRGSAPAHHDQLQPSVCVLPLGLPGRPATVQYQVESLVHLNNITVRLV